MRIIKPPFDIDELKIYTKDGNVNLTYV